MRRIKLLSPFTLPIYFFGATISLGTILLSLPACRNGQDLGLLDALFTATSATCVTGLIVADTGSFFSPAGHWVILGLIQLGGLGIMTYTSLVFYLWRKRVSLTDRIAVGQTLLHDPKFHLVHFLLQVLGITLCIEAMGAVLLFVLDSQHFSPFGALFHAVSAFCNAGFSLFPDSLSSFSGAGWINLVFMLLIVLGGLGFYVLLELRDILMARLRRRKGARLSWRSRTVLRTSLALILVGWAMIFVAEWMGQPPGRSLPETALAALFQSVSCRTAGFNTVDVGLMTNVSLLVMALLMVVGGSPGSCAGGIKTTTLRTLLAFGKGQILGRRQVVVGRFALDETTVNKALTLTIFAGVIITVATLLLSATEGGDVSHPVARTRLLDVLFEVVSAFGTVGLSTGLTAKLTPFGKVVIIALMFLGRLGPILFLSVLQSWRVRERFAWPESNLPIG